MIIANSPIDIIPYYVRGLENCLVAHVEAQGEVIGLEKLAYEWGVSPWWMRFCAHRAVANGRLKMERLIDRPGQPYRVTALEENHEN